MMLKLQNYNTSKIKMHCSSVSSLANEVKIKISNEPKAKIVLTHAEA